MSSGGGGEWPQGAEDKRSEEPAGRQAQHLALGQLVHIGDLDTLESCAQRGGLTA